MGCKLTAPLAAVLLIGSAAAGFAQNSSADAMRGAQNPAAGVKEDGPGVPSAKMEPGASGQGQAASPEQAPPTGSAKMETGGLPQGAGNNIPSDTVGSISTDREPPK